MKVRMGIFRVICWLKLMLVIVGSLTLLKYGAIKLLSFSPDPDDDVSTTAYLSPNGEFTAVHAERTGGGAIAPFCWDSVLVFNSMQAIDEVISQPKYQVYSAECDVFFDHESSPKISWNSDSELQINFAIGTTRTISRDVSLRASDASGKIQIKFSAYR